MLVALNILDSIFPVVNKSSLAVSKIISAKTISTKTTHPKSAQETSLFNTASLEITDNTVNKATGLKKKSVAIEIKQVKPLFSFPLKNYLSDTRKINLNIADQYIKEVHCQLTATGNNFYTIGFKSGTTYSLRNKNFKGFAGTGADITIFDHQTSIHYFRGRDELEGKNTGLNTLKELNTQLINIKIKDMSATYPQYKDLNDWLVDQY